jgi:phenylalanyl-tRNA synthetase beta chain
MEIARRKLRGEWSNGMLCSSAELGLGSDHSGIRILSADLALGTPIAEALGLEPDVLWDLEVNANRPDALCVAGLARDLAARFGVPFTMPNASPATGGDPATSSLGVEIVDPDLCGRFGAWLLRGLDTSAESPDWMQRRLAHLGMRPINALVDISNYVMLELGQPNHPYDLAGVPEGRFRVRRAREGETLTTLDDVERVLGPEDLLICGGDDVALGIAGVMGGASAEISDATTDIALEMAWFLPRAVGRTARRLGLRTEAAARFERGCDPEVIDLAVARFAALAEEICGTTLAPGGVDERGELPDRTPITVRPSRVNQVLGTDLDADAIRKLLEPIGFTTGAGSDGALDVAIPSWRYDATTEIDVVEEVARHYGYVNIPRRDMATAHPGRLSVVQRRRREVRRLLVGLGVTEVMPLPFLAPGDLEACGFPPDGIQLENSLIAEESVLRPSLLPGLVKAVATNAARRSIGVRLFEVGHVFRKGESALVATGGPGRADLLPDEREFLGVALAGSEAPEAVSVWLAVARLLGFDDAGVANAEQPGLHPSRSGVARIGAEVVGSLGEVDPAVLEAHGVVERVAWLEVDLGRLLAAGVGDREYREVSRFPSSDIDLAFEVPGDVSATDVEATLSSASPLVWSVRLFDVYRGSGVGEGARSLAYAIRFDSPERTLTDAEVAEARQALIDAVTATHGATLRT